MLHALSHPSLNPTQSSNLKNLSAPLYPARASARATCAALQRSAPSCIHHRALIHTKSDSSVQIPLDQVRRVYKRRNRHADSQSGALAFMSGIPGRWRVWYTPIERGLILDVRPRSRILILLPHLRRQFSSCSLADCLTVLSFPRFSYVQKYPNLTDTLSPISPSNPTAIRTQNSLSTS